MPVTEIHTQIDPSLDYLVPSPLICLYFFPLQISGQKDINHKNYQGIGGEIQVVDGYFVHFVAPENLPPMAKHVIFVLDVSGSMEAQCFKIGEKSANLGKMRKTFKFIL